MFCFELLKLKQKPVLCIRWSGKKTQEQMLQDVGEVMPLEGEGQKKWVPKVPRAIFKGVSHIPPSSQGHMGKTSILTEKRAKAKAISTSSPRKPCIAG